MRRLILLALMMVTLTSSTGCGVLREILCMTFTRRHCGIFPLRNCLPDCACESGCGEMYYGVLSDPPACHDPCDGCGNWTGSQTGYPGYLPHGGYAGYAGQPTPADGVVSRGHAPTERMASMGRAPSDSEMNLPPGAKVIHREDRVVSEAQSTPAQPVKSRHVPTRTTRHVHRNSPRMAQR